jgi:hypothetical protein
VIAWRPNRRLEAEHRPEVVATATSTAIGVAGATVGRIVMIVCAMRSGLCKGRKDWQGQNQRSDENCFAKNVSTRISALLFHKVCSPPIGILMIDAQNLQ